MFGIVTLFIASVLLVEQLNWEQRLKYWWQ